MIEIYLQSGFVTKKPIVALILQSSRYRWLKAEQINQHVTNKQLDSLAAIYALNHVRNKHRKKKVILYTNSEYLHQFLVKEGKEYKTALTSVKATANLRDIIDTFLDIKVAKLIQNDNTEELIHVYKECGLDDIILNEKS